MSFDTYANLKTALIEQLDRDDLTSKVDDFIDLAEGQHRQDIRIREMVTREAITVDDRYVSTPSGMLECMSIRLLTSPVTMLTNVSMHELMRFRREDTGKPRYYAINGTEFEFDADADSSYSGEIVYYKEETPLSDANTTNNLLTRAPGAYFYGALLHSAPYLMNDERLTVWAGLYREIVEGLSNARKQERHVGPLISRTSGPTP